MDVMLLRVFQAQVLFQVDAVVASDQRLRTALDAGDVRECWFAVESLLNAAANVSKALWGNKKTGPTRAPLRESLEITDASPLSPRKMRNKFEHYDEKLDEWWRDSKRHAHSDMTITPHSDLWGGYDAIDMFRHLNCATLEVVFWGQVLDINAIVEEAKRLRPIVAREAARPHY